MASITPTTENFTPIIISNKIIVDYTDACVFLSCLSCVLSVLGAIGIFVTYGLLPDIRNVTRKLIICLTVADLLSALGYLISVYRYFRIPTGSNSSQQLQVLCKVQSAITTYSSLVSFFITVCIGIHLSNTIINKHGSTGTTKALVIFNLISWIVPGVIVGIAFEEGVLGEDKSRTAGTGPWCWINTNAKHKTMWMWLTGKGWEIACYLLTMSIYVLMKFYLYLHHSRNQLHEIHPSLRNEDINVLYLWFVLYAVRIWGTIRFIIYSINPLVSHTENIMKAFLYLQAIGDPAQAFCNFLVFCVFDTTVQRHIKLKYHSLRSRDTCDQYDTLPAEPETEHAEGIGTESPSAKINTGNKQSYKSNVVNEDNWKRSGQSPRRTSSELTLLT